MCSPPMSSVDPDPQKIGYKAAELVDRIIRAQSLLQNHC